MTTYGKSIDVSEGQVQQGIRFTALVGSGGVTQGQPVKYDGSVAGTVVASAATSDYIVGVAANAASQGDIVCVLGNGCRVKVPYTLTINTKIGVSAGALVDYATGTCVGITETSATLASTIRIQIQV